MSSGTNRGFSPDVLDAVCNSTNLSRILASRVLLARLPVVDFEESSKTSPSVNLIEILQALALKFSESKRAPYFATTTWQDLDTAFVEGLEVFFKMRDGCDTETLYSQEIVPLRRLYWFVPDRNAYILDGNLKVDPCMLLTKRVIFDRLISYWVLGGHDADTTPSYEACEVFKFVLEFFAQGSGETGITSITSDRNIECFRKCWEKGDPRIESGKHRNVGGDLPVMLEVLKAHISKFERDDIAYWSRPSFLKMGQSLPVELSRLLAGRLVGLMSPSELAMALALPSVGELRLG